MKVLLEYSETQGLFHCNYKETTGQFHNELFVNGYHPIAILDEDTVINDGILGEMMDRAMRNRYPFEKTAREILFYLLP